MISPSEMYFASTHVIGLKSNGCLRFRRCPRAGGGGRLICSKRPGAAPRMGLNPAVAKPAHLAATRSPATSLESGANMHVGCHIDRRIELSRTTPGSAAETSPVRIQARDRPGSARGTRTPKPCNRGVTQPPCPIAGQSCGFWRELVSGCGSLWQRLCRAVLEGCRDRLRRLGEPLCGQGRQLSDEAAGADAVAAVDAGQRNSPPTSGSSLFRRRKNHPSAQVALKVAL